MWKKSRRPASAMSRPLASVVAWQCRLTRPGMTSLPVASIRWSDGPGVRAADEHDAVVLEGEAPAAQEPVSPVVIGDDVPAVDDRSHRDSVDRRRAAGSQFSPVVPPWCSPGPGRSGRPLACRMRPRAWCGGRQGSSRSGRGMRMPIVIRDTTVVTVRRRPHRAPRGVDRGGRRPHRRHRPDGGDRPPLSRRRARGRARQGGLPGARQLPHASVVHRGPRHPGGLRLPVHARASRPPRRRC